MCPEKRVGPLTGPLRAFGANGLRGPASSEKLPSHHETQGTRLRVVSTAAQEPSEPVVLSGMGGAAVATALETIYLVRRVIAHEAWLASGGVEARCAPLPMDGARSARSPPARTSRSGSARRTKTREVGTRQNRPGGSIVACTSENDGLSTRRWRPLRHLHPRECSLALRPVSSTAIVLTRSCAAASFVVPSGADAPLLSFSRGRRDPTFSSRP